MADSRITCARGQRRLRKTSAAAFGRCVCLRAQRDVELRRASVSHAQEGGNGNGNGNHNGNGNGAALPDTLLWVGTYSIPCASLPVVTHLEVSPSLIVGVGVGAGVGLRAHQS